MERLRAMPRWEKVRIADEMYDAEKRQMLAGLRAQYPQTSEAELERRLAGLLRGPELAERVYGLLEKADEGPP
ncbi:MAG TPA: hypothetical protein PKW05_06710 [Anaerolineae bacterium]|nr:hypothetical protein [Anaerolineae bacterium]HQJ51451.1 hypothetical protein [Anaerolineae bacterium]